MPPWFLVLILGSQRLFPPSGTVVHCIFVIKMSLVQRSSCLLCHIPQFIGGLHLEYISDSSQHSPYTLIVEIQATFYLNLWSLVAVKRSSRDSFLVFSASYSCRQIIDSIMALFRVDFSGRGELAERQQKLAQMLSRLQKISEGLN